MTVVVRTLPQHLKNVKCSGEPKIKAALKVLGKSVGGWNAKVLSYEVKWLKNCQMVSQKPKYCKRFASRNSSLENTIYDSGD